MVGVDGVLRPEAEPGRGTGGALRELLDPGRLDEPPLVGRLELREEKKYTCVTKIRNRIYCKRCILIEHLTGFSSLYFSKVLTVEVFVFLFYPRLRER